MGRRETPYTRPNTPLKMLARSESVEFDEFGQGYSESGEVVLCICGHAYPGRGPAHYCPYDEGETE